MELARKVEASPVEVEEVEAAYRGLQASFLEGEAMEAAIFHQTPLMVENKIQVCSQQLQDPRLRTTTTCTEKFLFNFHL